MNSNIKIIESSNKDDFQVNVNNLLSKGYKIVSSSIGFVNSEQYDFCSCYQAMLLKEDK